MAVVVVLPCVPVTTMECLPGRKSSSRISGSERCGSLRSSISSTSTFPREMALPTTIRSGARGQVFCVERTGEWNGQRFEERRGRWIYARVGASDPVAAFAQHARERGHGRAADANHVDVLHVCFVISRLKSCL